ncbi:hypothetical protein WICPIJ_004103, partial [Wickerhamomyces pijperi]
AVADALYRYLLGCDTSNVELFDSSFTENSTFTLNGQSSKGLAEIRANVYDRISKLDTTHSLTNIRINIESSEVDASITANAISQHYRQGKGLAPGESSLLVGTLYNGTLTRDKGSSLWKIKDLSIKMIW